MTTKNNQIKKLNQIGKIIAIILGVIFIIQVLVIYFKYCQSSGNINTEIF